LRRVSGMRTLGRFGELFIGSELVLYLSFSILTTIDERRKPYEVLYIATDEKNRSWFDDFKNSHSGPLRYLSDYAQLIGLGDLDVTVYGLVDTLVASRGSIFAGTWFSTFSGYIVRLRGYHGLSKFSTYYSWQKVLYAHMDEFMGGILIFKRGECTHHNI
jgi:hypothetical protein